MRTSQGAAVLVVVLVVAVPLVPAAAVAAEPAVQATPETGGNETAAYGMQVTAYMQSNAAAVNESVEDEMWVAGFEHANESQQARLATRRVTHIDRRLDRLGQRRASLARQYANGSLPQAAYVARATQLSARIVALQESVERTDRVAGDHVDQSRLRQIRSESKNLTSPPMAGIALGVAAGPRDKPGEAGQGNANGTRGPPGDRGNATGNGGDAAAGDRGDRGNANGGSGSSDGNADGNSDGNNGKPGNSGGADSNGQNGASDPDGSSGPGGPSSGDRGGEP